MRAFEYHNLGNEYYKKEEFDKAVEEYNKALELKPDLLETYFNRGLAHTRKKKYDSAIFDLNKVVELNPNLAEAYYTRGLVYEYKQNNEKALENYDRALSCDPAYDKASKQRSLIYIRVIRLRAEDKKFLNWLKKADKKIRDERALRIFSEIGENKEKFINSIERPSCDINCGSLCCYFKDEPWQNSVLIEPRKLNLVKKFLIEKGENPDDFIGRIEWKKFIKIDEKSKSDKRKYIVNENGKKYVHYPRIDFEKKLPQHYVEHIPKTLNNDEIEWITPESHPCKFISQEACSIHSIGKKSDKGLNVCREWVCLTGYVIILLRLLGVLEPDGLKGCKMRDLNKIAKKSLPLLHDEIYGDKRLIELEREWEDVIREIVTHIDEIDNLSEDINRYNQLKEDYKKELDARINKMGEKVLIFS